MRAWACAQLIRLSPFRRKRPLSHIQPVKAKISLLIDVVKSTPLFVDAWPGPPLHVYYIGPFSCVQQHSYIFFFSFRIFWETCVSWSNCASGMGIYEPRHGKRAVIAYQKQQRFRRACASAQSRQKLCCSLPLAVGLGKTSAKELGMLPC